MLIQRTATRSCSKNNSTVQMIKLSEIILLFAFLVNSCFIHQPLAFAEDVRNSVVGTIMYQWGYLDQPYCIVAPYNTTNGAIPAGRWVCASSYKM